MKHYLFVFLLVFLFTGCSSTDDSKVDVAPATDNLSSGFVPASVKVYWDGVNRGIVVEWKESEEAKMYLVERSDDGAGYLPITYVTLATTFTDRGIEQFHSYRYRVETIIDGEMLASLPSIPITPPDFTPPETELIGAPSAVTTSRYAIFSFVATDPGDPYGDLTFQCRLDDEDWRECVSPVAYDVATFGRHTFQVRSIDPSGNMETPPIAYTWEVTTTIWRMISGGVAFMCGLTDSGWLFCWGGNNEGQLGIGDYDTAIYYDPQPLLQKGWIYVATGKDHACAIDRGRDLYCWGNNDSGKLGYGASGYANENRRSPIMVYEDVMSAGNWASVSAGNENTCGIKLDGSLWCWGSNDNGMLAIGRWESFIYYDSPVSVTGSNEWKAVFLSRFFDSACAIKRDGALWCWGNNQAGQLGTGDNISRNYPVMVSDSHWVKIVFFADDENGMGTLGLKDDGSLWTWGSSMFLGLTDTTRTYSPRRLTSGRYKDISAGFDNLCALKVDGTLLCWGSNATQQLGEEDVTVTYKSPDVVVPGEKWNSMAVSFGTFCGIDEDGSLWCRGNNEWGGLGVRDEEYTGFKESDYAYTISKLDEGKDGFICAIDDDTRLLCWGNNMNGELGTGDRINRKFPTLVTSERGWKFVATANNASFAINENDQLFAWGSNYDYQLGLATAGYGEDILTPTLVGDGWRMVNNKDGTTCGIKTNGTLWCWGNKLIGTYTLTHIKTPQLATDLVGWKDVAAAARVKCAIRDDDTLWCWERTHLTGYDVQLDGPVLVSSDRWRKIYAYNYNVCGIKADGTLWCWGDNTNGELGLGDVSPRNNIVQVGADRDWKEIMLGYEFTCGLKENGDLFCWGKRDPFHSPKTLVPRYVPSGSIWSNIGGFSYLAYQSYYFSALCLLDVRGRLYCSGNNATGLMGLLHSPYDDDLYHVTIDYLSTY